MPEIERQQTLGKKCSSGPMPHLPSRRSRRWRSGGDVCDLHSVQRQFGAEYRGVAGGKCFLNATPRVQTLKGWEIPPFQA